MLSLAVDKEPSISLVYLTYRAMNNAVVIFQTISLNVIFHDDVIKWKYFPRYWPFVWGIHRLPVNTPHKGQWRRALMFSLICAWSNDWVNNGEAGDLIHHRAHYDVTVMINEMFSIAILMCLFSEPNWHQVFTTSGYQAVTWTNGDTVCLHKYASLGTPFINMD